MTRPVDRPHRTPGPARDAERDAEAVRLYLQGASLRAVGEALSLSHEGVRTALRTRHVTLRGRGRPRSG